jgi:hypothetical protein
VTTSAGIQADVQRHRAVRTRAELQHAACHGQSQVDHRARPQPPTEVADAFNDVQRAEQDEDRLQEEARTSTPIRCWVTPAVEAAQVREEAAAYKQPGTLQEAEGEAARFLSVYAEYAKSPDVTRKRLYPRNHGAGAGRCGQGDHGRPERRLGRRALPAAAGDPAESRR